MSVSCIGLCLSALDHNTLKENNFIEYFELFNELNQRCFVGYFDPKKLVGIEITNILEWGKHFGNCTLLKVKDFHIT